MTTNPMMEPPVLLTIDEIEQAFDEAFPRHELHQGSVDYARAVERLVLAKLERLALARLILTGFIPTGLGSKNDVNRS